MSKRVKINLAKSAGFCFGVKRAINIALEAAKTKDRIYMLGDIVHNEDVVKKIKQTGIKKISTLRKGKNKTLLIRAHGISGETFKKAQSLGYKIIDATCPMVREIHKIAREYEKKGYSIIVIGDRKHDEVLGIIGQLKKRGIIIDSSKIPFKDIKKMRKTAIVVQSTQDFEKVCKTAEVFKRYIKDLKFFNTICNPTRKKQQEIKKMSLCNDLMIIIGSKQSANTKRLYQISKSLNKRSYWINSKDDLKSGWFKNAKTIGITTGASTPQSTTRQIISCIKEIKG